MIRDNYLRYFDIGLFIRIIALIMIINTAK